MPGHRDRHQRGLRGPLAPPGSAVGQALKRQRPTGSVDLFIRCVTETLAAIERACPEALAGIDIGLEDVPDTSALWTSRVPLAAAQDATEHTTARIVVYRRPIEHRALSRRELRELVFSTIVEQVSALTGISQDDLDPEGRRGED